MEDKQALHHSRALQLDTAESLALALNVSQAWVRKWTRYGLPHYKLGKSTRYQLGEVLAYLKSKQGQ